MAEDLYALYRETDLRSPEEIAEHSFNRTSGFMRQDVVGIVANAIRHERRYWQDRVENTSAPVANPPHPCEGGCALKAARRRFAPRKGNSK